MPSTAIIGLPGGGKSYYAVERLLHFLETDSRQVVTNIPLVPEKVEEFILSRNGDFSVLDRLTLIDPLDFTRAKSFYLHRGAGKVLDRFPESFDEFSQGGVVDLEAIEQSFGGGVVYFLDEVHQFLNARNWSSVGGDILRYLSLHRHLGDDIFWITQAPGNVDKQWRSLTQSYFTCRNFKFEKFRGFSKGSGLEVRETLNIPSPHNTEIAQSVVNRPINPKVAQCYKTSIIHGDADTKRKSKGISYKWLIVAVFVVLIGGAFGVSQLFKYGTKRISTAFRGNDKKPTTAALPSEVPFDSLPAPAPAPSSSMHQSASSVASSVQGPIHRPDAIAPPGYVPTVENPSLMLPEASHESKALGILPPEPSPLTVQVWINKGSSVQIMINGNVYKQGDMLENGATLVHVPTYSRGFPVSRDPYGRFFFHPPTNQPDAIPALDSLALDIPTDKKTPEPPASLQDRDVPGQNLLEDANGKKSPFDRIPMDMSPAK